MPKVTSIEQRADKHGNPMKVTNFDNGKKVFVNSKYDDVIYDKVIEGSEWELVPDGDFTKIKYEKPKSGGGSKAGMTAVMEKKSENVKEAQERKSESITLAAAQRDAVLVITNLYPELASYEEPHKTREIESKYHQWRKFFLNANHPLDVPPFESK